MKNLILSLCLLLLITSCNTQDKLPPNTYEITGTAKGVVNGLRAYIKVVEGSNKEFVLDTAIVMNETFTFSGKLNTPGIKVLSINSVNGSLPFVLESGRTTIEINKDSIFSSNIIGSDNNKTYDLFKASYLKRAKEKEAMRNKAIEARKAGDRAAFEKFKSKDQELGRKLNEYAHTFIEEHPDADASLLILESQTIGSKQNISKFKENLKTLEKVINRNPANKLIGQKISAFINLKESQNKLDIGKVAPNFSAPTPEGKMLSLKDIKGKATIIDFWASWCGPCRRENPNVVKVYNKYHDKGLEIISVSLDGTRRQKDPKALWLQAIEDDKLTWHHVSNLKYFNDPVARLYNINAIPATFILDEDGKIVAKKLRGDALERQIAKMLD